MVYAENTSKSTEKPEQVKKKRLNTRANYKYLMDH